MLKYAILYDAHTFDIRMDIASKLPYHFMIYVDKIKYYNYVHIFPA